MAIYTTVSIDGIELGAVNIVPTRTQKTIKQIIGKTVVETRILGLAGQQWNLQISGIITGASGTLSAERASIEALDDAAGHTYVDGIHDGTYFVETGSLRFEDVSDDAGMYYKFSMNLIEE